MKKQKKNDITSPSSHLCPFFEHIRPLIVGSITFFSNSWCMQLRLTVNQSTSDTVETTKLFHQDTLFNIAFCSSVTSNSMPSSGTFFSVVLGLPTRLGFSGVQSRTFPCKFTVARRMYSKCQPPPLYNFRRAREGTIEVFICNMCLPGYVLLFKGMFH